LPTILTRLENGDVTLTTITLLAAHLTDENHEALLDAVRHKSKRDVERLVAALDPQPDFTASIRRQPSPIQPQAHLLTEAAKSAPAPAATNETVADSRPAKPAVVVPLAPSRYLMKLTVSQETHDKLQQARDLLRHTIPNGDPAAIIDRALTALIAQLEKTKRGATARPRTDAATASPNRHVPAAVKRTVWARDEGRCAFVGAEGRCPETGWLEFHHLVPFAVGGETSTKNVELRCRSHNAHEAERFSELCPDRVFLATLDEMSVAKLALARHKICARARD